MKILAISGSTRKESFNTKLLHVIKNLASSLADVEVMTINNIPMFNQDLENDVPQVVKALKQKVKDADALIIATPEYSNMIPGALKNVIEWLSREYDNVLVNKESAIVGCSNGGFGTVRAQMQLLTLSAIVGMNAHGKFRFPVSKAQDKFDEQGNLIDKDTYEKLEAFVKQYIDFLHKELNV